METGTLFKRESSKSSFTDDDEPSRMSDLENEYHTRGMSLTSSLPASPSASSYNKMSVDSDDARSVSSASRRDTNTMETATIILPMTSASESSSSASSASASASPSASASASPSASASASASTSASASAYASSPTVITSTTITTSRTIRPIGSSWVNSSNNNIRQQDELFLVDCNNATKNIVQTKSYDLRERRDPERRNVSRRSSLLPKSKALLRVIDQADEDTHLGDTEMRREHETTVQLKTFDNDFVVAEQEGVPAASWTKVADFPLYQCSKLNPEVEMTSFQLENMASLSPQQQQTYKSIKRKASEDRFEPYPTSIGLKRRAVSPSVSLHGSPILTGYSSPPTSFSSYYGPGGPGGGGGSSGGGGGGTSPNAAARLQHKPSHHSNNSSFNLHDASGSLSRMSLSE